ncbi:MAG: glycosyltransferase [Pelagibacteraceae bacterium TMED124]|nr:MAG: glycosyltransferase [Pelagibacteraceae bacterium TMED124]|tara:strand:+ start:5510 stop:6499 length:990 start_codon:yes stop_codon:yes gene_type:complete
MISDNWKLFIQRKSNSIKTTKVACILAYYNGSEFIKDQLQSIINQKQETFDLTIFISDDNSQESFPSLENLNIDQNIDLEIFYRKSNYNLGYAKNFISSLNLIGSEYDYYCFSDQDDVWLSNKLEKAIRSIEKLSTKKPVLYGGRTTYYDAECSRKLGYSLLFKKKPSFRNAIIQNICGGNTMVFNNHARNIIVKSITNNFEIVSHDWWCYQIISGSGGIVYYDKLPFIKYRQHGNNILGANNFQRAKLSRIISLLAGNFRIWNNINLEALNKNRILLTKENQLILSKLNECRKHSLLRRIISFYSLGIHRQTNFGNLALLIAIILKRL